MATAAILSIMGGMALGGCSLSMQLASLQIDPETTASVTKSPSPLDPALNEEDWRRAQSALSLAVDPQGSGQAVNWDNPASKRKGSFAAAGNLVLVDNTVCRAFNAVVIELGTTKPRETRHAGRACRTGPGEWAMREVQPAQPEATASTDRIPLRIDGGQPLPAPTSSMLDAQAFAE